MPLIAPSTGFHQCLLDPLKNKPADFFNALFDSNMYMIMAEETNKYVFRKKLISTKNFFHFYISNENLSTKFLLM